MSISQSPHNEDKCRQKDFHSQEQDWRLTCEFLQGILFLILLAKSHSIMTGVERSCATGYQRFDSLPLQFTNAGIIFD